MKIVGFVGSPRKGGNTDILVKEVLAGAAEKGAETEVFYLNALDIKGCQGCLKCNDEADRCVVQDGMTPLYDQIYGVGGIVIGSPIYMLQMTGQTKLFLDRLFALLNTDYSPRFRKGLPVVLVYTQQANDPESFRSYLDTIDWIYNELGFRVVETIVAGGTIEREDILKQTELLEKAKDTGRNLTAG